MDIYWSIVTLRLAKPCGNGKYASRPDESISQSVNQQEDQLDGTEDKFGSYVKGNGVKPRYPRSALCASLSSIEC